MSRNWLNQLAAAHAPPASGWWPPAPGWWLLATLLLAGVVVCVAWQRSPRRRVRRLALRQLERIRASDADGPAVARAIQDLLRRYAVQVFGYDAVAGLTGDSWLDFVASQGGTSLSGTFGKSLLNAAYGHHDLDDRRQWLLAAERFIARAGRGRRTRSLRDSMTGAPGSSGVHGS